DQSSLDGGKPRRGETQPLGKAIRAVQRGLRPALSNLAPSVLPDGTQKKRAQDQPNCRSRARFDG
ncbi:MAG TPA: hypothetical protein VGN42_26935, partial [Pirellulales bacterium]|nr:hypothetical protein [Pirellulales bacterium]